MGSGLSTITRGGTHSQPSHTQSHTTPSSAAAKGAAKIAPREIVVVQQNTHPATPSPTPVWGADDSKPTAKTAYPEYSNHNSNRPILPVKTDSLASLDNSPPVVRVPYAQVDPLLKNPANPNSKPGTKQSTIVVNSSTNQSNTPIVNLQVRKQNSVSCLQRSIPVGDITYDMLTAMIQKSWNIPDYHLLTETEDGDNVEVIDQDGLSGAICSQSITANQKVIFYVCTTLPKPAAPAPSATKASSNTKPQEAPKQSGNPESLGIDLDEDIDEIEAREIREEKKTMLYLRCHYDGEDDVFCTIPSDTTFWELLTRLRYAFGHAIYLCRKEKGEIAPIRTPELFESIISEYKLSSSKYLDLIVHKDVEEVDSEEDELEHLLEEKKTTVFFRCVVGTDSVLDCSFPYDMKYSELWGRLISMFGTQIKVFALLNQQKVPINDEETFAKALKEYASNTDRYLNVEVVQDFEDDINTIPAPSPGPSDLVRKHACRLHILFLPP
eukprot:TRINITY_DN2840_c0_g1_i7.p1 TRINITY_DN2840_c0_g1~~TRINITY_DN2840_c0_g1_i7.p1  ORF type:complete len:496 (-),score=97.60 TRINITY_DN2840_c0_g1_i7:168-1655(-)